MGASYSGSKTGSSLDLSRLRLPHVRRVLRNGLTVVVVARPAHGLVGINVAYHVGSKDEQPGKTGLAHIVEHLMYAGSEHHPESYLPTLERLGATTINANATEDYTTYFATIPAFALSSALWLESERMAHLLGALTQANLNRQREIVRNELRERSSLPFGDVGRLIRANTYPDNHPYRWSPLGNLEDLDSITTSDVREWFERFYGASNAMLVIAGDVTAEVVFDQVEKFFEGVSPGTTVERWKRWELSRHGSKKKVLYRPGALASVYKVWNVAPWSSSDHALLELVGEILSGPRGSLLAVKLSAMAETPVDVSFELSDGELSSQLIIRAHKVPPDQARSISDAIEQEVTRFIRHGAPQENLYSARLTRVKDLLFKLERLTGPASLTEAIVKGELFAGDPAFYVQRIEQIANADSEQLLDAAARWLSGGCFTLEILPAASRTFSSSNAKVYEPPMPFPGHDSHRFTGPRVGSLQLDNGLKVFYSPSAAAPLVVLRAIVKGGLLGDFASRKGLAAVTVAMLCRAATGPNRAPHVSQLSLRGTSLRGSVGLDTITLEISSLDIFTKEAFEVLAESLTGAKFDPDDLERQKKQLIAQIETEKSHPLGLLKRVMPHLMFDPSHPWAQPFSGSGFVSDVNAISIEEVEGFHERWFRPELSSLIVIQPDSDGLNELMAQAFTKWGKQRTDFTVMPEAPAARVSRPSLVSVLVMPSAEQSIIAMGSLAPALKSPQAAAWQIASALVAEMLSSRLNSRLREEDGWSYGVRTLTLPTRAERPYLIYAAVDKERTGTALEKMIRELEKLVGPEAIGDEEFERARAWVASKIMALSESSLQLADALESLAIGELEPDYYERLLSDIARLAPEDIRYVLKTVLDPQVVSWLTICEPKIAAQQIGSLGYRIELLELANLLS